MRVRALGTERTVAGVSQLMGDTLDGPIFAIVESIRYTDHPWLNSWYVILMRLS